MAENMKKELEQWEFKEEIVSIQEPVGDTCTVHKQEDDAQMEYTEIKDQFKKQLSGICFNKLLLNITLFFLVKYSFCIHMKN